ncbi:MAG: CxxC-x17-CxxC domain-containing protein [Candidatus Marinamargulisbacteria bacterium]|jgi:CxxC-x17-CxxC domain-containing protein
MGSMERKRKQKSGGRSEGAGKKRYSNSDNRDSASKTLSRVACTTCGKSCQVPFKPIEGKPIYCNDCFRNNKVEFSEGKSPRFNRDAGSSRREFGAENRRSSPDLEQINAKLDRILRLLED